MKVVINLVAPSRVPKKQVVRAVQIMVLAAALLLAIGCGMNKITVNGTVVNHVGIPLSAVLVLIGEPGQHWPAYTDANGQFTVEDVETPYDIYLFTYGCPCWPAAEVVYQGLTLSDPVLAMAVTVVDSNIHGPPDSQATISGQLSGGAGFSDHPTRVAFSSQESYPWADAQSDGSFSWVSNFGRPSVMGDLHALQWQADGNDLPALYTGYGTRGPVVLNDGVNLPGQDIALGSIDTGQVSGAATLPAGYSLTLRTMGLRAGEYGYLPIVDEIDPADPAFTYQVPQLSGGKISVSLQAENPAGDSSTAARVVAPGTSGISMTLPAAVSLIQPADGATGVDGSTLFAWTQFPGGVHTFTMTVTYPGYPESMHTLTVVTAATSFTIDGLAQALNTSYFDENPCFWAVSASTLCPTVDAAAGGNASGAAPADSEAAASAIRTFTSAP